MLPVAMIIILWVLFNMLFFLRSLSLSLSAVLFRLSVYFYRLKSISMAQISEGLMNVANKKVAARKKRGGESGGDVGLAGVREKISTLNEIVCVCVSEHWTVIRTFQ